MAKNATIDAIGANVDIAVTIADLAGVSIPAEAEVDGHSLKPVLLGAFDSRGAGGALCGCASGSGGTSSGACIRGGCCAC